jgi:predicted transcriptional regulator
MGATKKYFYNENQLLISSLCKALGHPARVTIIELLSQNEHMNCMDLQSKIKLSQSSISDHCQTLHHCGIIGYEVLGNNCFYHLNNTILNDVVDFVNTINIEPTSITGNVYYPKSAF